MDWWCHVRNTPSQKVGDDSEGMRPEGRRSTGKVSSSEGALPQTSYFCIVNTNSEFLSQSQKFQIDKSIVWMLTDCCNCRRDSGGPSHVSSTSRRSSGHSVTTTSSSCTVGCVTRIKRLQVYFLKTNISSNYDTDWHFQVNPTI